MQLKDRFFKRPSLFQQMLNQDWLYSSILKSTDFVALLGGLLFILSTLLQKVMTLIEQYNSKSD
jgi:hypothetical protein